MKERQIIFSVPMIRTILNGRKTQTRRIVKPQPEVSGLGNLAGEWLSRPLGGLLLPKVSDIAQHCPYGPPGTRLWVQEDFALGWDACGDDHVVFYRATGDGYIGDERHPVSDVLSGKFGLSAGEPACTAPSRVGWTSADNMPRWASRITLEVTGVRVERLQGISEDDAYAEGVTHAEYGGVNARDGFRHLWESIYGPGSWAANPWVWVIDFRRLEGEAV